MSLLHADFVEFNAELIGTPAAARLAVEALRGHDVADCRALSAASRAGFAFPSVRFAFHAPVDPVRHPADLCLPVRAFAATEVQLAVMARAMGVDFWGEAVSLVLAHAAAFPDEFGAARLKDTAPDGLLKSKGAIRRGKVMVPAGVRGIQVPLTRATSDFLSRVAHREKLSRVDAASLILHRHVARVLARIASRA